MNTRLYPYQYVSMAGLFCLTNIFLPGMVARTAGKSFYPAFLPAFLIGILLILLYGRLLKNCRGGICTAARERLGKPLGSAVGAVYVLYFLFAGCELMSFYGLYASGEDTVFLYLAPFALAATFAGGKSTTILGRAALIFGVFALALAATLGVSGIFSGNWENLRFFSSAEPMELGKLSLALAATGWGQLLAVMTIAPAEDRKQKYSLIAAAVSNGIVLLIALTSLLIEGQTPLLNEVRFFSYAVEGKLSQLRVIAEAILFLCAVFRVSVCLRAAVHTAGELFSLPDERPLAPAFGALLFAMGVGFAENIGAAAEFVLLYSPCAAALPLLILPLLLLCFGRKKVNP